MTKRRPLPILALLPIALSACSHSETGGANTGNATTIVTQGDAESPGSFAPSTQRPTTSVNATTGSSPISNTSIPSSTTVSVVTPKSTPTTPSSTSTTPTSIAQGSSTTAAPPKNPTFTVNADTGIRPTFSVALGDTVTLKVNASMEQEFHLHGYDIELGGTAVTFIFTADTAGRFVVESHTTGATICTLVVG